MKTLLLTGFEPFDGEVRNPSREIALALDGEIVHGHRIVGIELPVVYGGSAERLIDLIATHQPALVACLGVARDRDRITPELTAFNRDDATIADNAGLVRRDMPILPGGPASLPTTLPLEAMLAALAHAGIPAAASPSAGAFVCNHLFYQLQHHLAAKLSVPPSGFIHVPPFSDQWTLERLTAALRIALHAALG